MKVLAVLEAGYRSSNHDDVLGVGGGVRLLAGEALTMSRMSSAEVRRVRGSSIAVILTAL